LPRRSSASLSVAAFTPDLRRLEPPTDLQGVERETFVHTVASLPASHFLPEDIPLLRAYCSTVALAKQAAAELQLCPVVGSAPSPWLKVHSSLIRSLAQLTTRLRLGPRSRSNNQRSAKSGRTPSGYEALGLSEPRPWGKT
jgi:phage terminase small subunit